MNHVQNVMINAKSRPSLVRPLQNMSHQARVAITVIQYEHIDDTILIGFKEACPHPSPNE